MPERFSTRIRGDLVAAALQRSTGRVVAVAIALVGAIYAISVGVAADVSVAGSPSSSTSARCPNGANDLSATSAAGDVAWLRLLVAEGSPSSEAVVGSDASSTPEKGAILVRVPTDAPITVATTDSADGEQALPGPERRQQSNWCRPGFEWAVDYGLIGADRRTVVVHQELNSWTFDLSELDAV